MPAAPPTCPECRGKGMVFVPADKHGRSPKDPRERHGYWKVCPRCDGRDHLLTAEAMQVRDRLLAEYAKKGT